MTFPGLAFHLFNAAMSAWQGELLEPQLRLDDEVELTYLVFVLEIEGSLHVFVHVTSLPSTNITTTYR